MALGHLERKCLNHRKRTENQTHHTPQSQNDRATYINGVYIFEFLSALLSFVYISFVYFSFLIQVIKVVFLIISFPVMLVLYLEMNAVFTFAKTTKILGMSIKYYFTFPSSL